MSTEYIQTVSHEATILLVSVAPFELERPNSNILANIRREFFEKGYVPKSKVTETWGGIACKYLYGMSKISPLRWKKYERDILVEYVELENEYYYIESINPVDFFVNKRIFFSRHHKWMKSEYMMWNQTGPAKTIKPHLTSDNTNLLLIESGRESILYPCLMPENEHEMQDMRSITKVPEISCFTTEGYFYYAPFTEAAAWGKTLLKLRENRDSLINGLIDENVDIENGFNVDIDAIKNSEADYKINIPVAADDIEVEYDEAVFETAEEKELSPQDAAKSYNDKLFPSAQSQRQSQLAMDIDEAPVTARSFTRDPLESIEKQKENYLDSLFRDIANNVMDNEPSVIEKDDTVPYFEPNAPTFFDKLTQEENSLFTMHDEIRKVSSEDNLNSDKTDINKFDDTLVNEDLPIVDSIEEPHTPTEEKLIDTSYDISELLSSEIGNEQLEETDLENSTDIPNENLPIVDSIEEPQTQAEERLTDASYDISELLSSEIGNEQLEEKDLENSTDMPEVPFVNTVDDSITDNLPEILKSADLSEDPDVSDLINALDAAHDASSLRDTQDKDIETADFSDRNNRNNTSTKLPWSIDKIVPVSSAKKYYYTGTLTDGNRHGNGRTAMESGHTAYEGEYRNDKRDGFGVYYYKTGKLCHVGSWKENRRNGLGVAFNSSDNSMTAGRWENNIPVGPIVKLDDNGYIEYVGYANDGVKNGAGILFNRDNGNILVGRYINNESFGKGTLFSSDGQLLYNGDIVDGVRNGFGNAFKSDGTILYRGNWQDNKYHGFGTLYMQNGETISGSFENGFANGKAIHRNFHGNAIYDGNWKNGKYDGFGRLYNDDGSYIECIFEQGEASGNIERFDKNGQIMFKGTYTETKDGIGTEYKDSVKVYEGGYLNGMRNGFGNEYSDGELVYSGNFVNNVRTGYGTETVDGHVYSGMWKNDMYNGAGVLYLEGEQGYAGNFSDGRPDGRVNIISGKAVVSECIFKDGVCIFMKRYSDDGKKLLFEGSIRDELPNGMGCEYSQFGEKIFEGIYKNGKQARSTKIIMKPIEPLAPCKELEETDYKLYLEASEYAVEKPLESGIYSGQLKNGLPNGDGTMLYSDHSYTGNFRNGNAYGKGTIFCSDGNEIEGIFHIEPVSQCKIIELDDVTYYVTNTEI